MMPSDNNSTHAFDPPQIDGPFGPISGAEANIPCVVPTPAVVAGYHVERELGRGGMGVVYLATQDGLNRKVALKMVLSGEHASTTEKGRFLAEAEAVAAVRHPGVVQVFDFGTHEGRPYFALEYLSGGSLAAKLNGTPLPVPEAAKLVEAITRAVQAAHDAGVIHRDLKPANILYDADGTPKVTDFGLARKADTQSGLTATGAVLGTPSYMAPEQAQGRKDLGTTADVYALGAVLYECLTGRPPFRAASPLETVLQVMKDEPVPPSRFTPKLPRDLETVCLKCLSKDPQRRYSTAGAMADDLKRFRDGEPILARPVSSVERSWRWVRRNKAMAAVVVGGPVLLAGTTIIVLIALLMTAVANVRLAAERQNADNQKREAEIHQAEAEKQRGLAHARLTKAVEAIDRMMTRVNSERWATNPNLQDERRQVLEEAVTFFNGFTAEDSADPRVRFETAKAHTRVAAAYLMLSDLTKSTHANRQALKLYDGLMAEYPEEAAYKAGASEAFTFSGGVSSLSAQYIDALIAYNRAVELADAAVALDPGSNRYKLRAVDARSSLAFFYLESDRAQGEKVLGPMLRLAQEIGNDPNAPFEYRVALAFTLAVAATYDQTAPKVAMVQTRTTAVDRYDEAQSILDGLRGQSAPSAHAWDQFAHTRAYVAVQRAFIAILQAVTSSQRRAAAEQMKKGLELYDTLLRVNPKAFPYRLQKYQALRSMVNIYAMLGDYSASAKANASADRLISDMIRDHPHLGWLRGMDALRQTMVLIERVRTDKRFAFETEGAKLIEAANPGNKGDVTYNVACIYAVACDCCPQADEEKCVIRAVAMLNGAWVERGEESRKEMYAARAVALLNDLAKTEYFYNPRRVAHLGEDSDLDSLRSRDDFKAFLAVVKKPSNGRLKTR